MNLLRWVLEGEKFNILEDVIEELIGASDGCPREALVTLDQIIDLPVDKMIDAIQQTEANREVKELCQAMLKGADWNKLRKILKGLKGTEPERCRKAIIHYMKVVALNNPDAAQAALIFDCFRENVFYTSDAGITFAAYNTTLD